MVQSIEVYSLQNICNQINSRRSQTSTLYIRFPVLLRWAMHQVCMYFLRKTVFHFLQGEKRSCFQEKNKIFPDDTRKMMCRCGPSWKDHLFRKFKESIIFSCIFFRKVIFYFPSNEKNHIFGQKNHLSQYYKKDHLPAQFFALIRAMVGQTSCFKRVDAF